MGAGDSRVEVRLTLGGRPSLYTVVMVLVCVTDCTFFLRNRCRSLSDIWSKVSCKSPRSEGTTLRLDRGVSPPLFGPLSSPSPSGDGGGGGAGLRRGCLPPCVGLVATGPRTLGMGDRLTFRAGTPTPAGEDVRGAGGGGKRLSKMD